MPVSACTRLPTRSAVWAASCSTLPTVAAWMPVPYAPRSCPRICDSPTTIESSPAATRSRCSAAASSKCTYRWSPRKFRSIPEVRASTLEMCTTAGWKRATSAYTSTRLQVDSSITSEIDSPRCSSSITFSSRLVGTLACSSTDTGAE